MGSLIHLDRRVRIHRARGKVRYMATTSHECVVVDVTKASDDTGVEQTRFDGQVRIPWSDIRRLLQTPELNADV